MGLADRSATSEYRMGLADPGEVMCKMHLVVHLCRLGWSCSQLAPA